MLEIINTRVYGLKESIARSGLPHQLGRPDLEALSEGAEKRACSLGNVDTGSGHDTYLKGIVVQFDIKYSGYLTPQLQRYHWIDIISSQSKMVKLKKVSLRDSLNKYVDEEIIKRCVEIQREYQENPSYKNRMRLLSNLPHGYEQWMGVSTNYLQLKTIYHQRRRHRLKEDWRVLCDWIEGLPRFAELVLGVVPDEGQGGAA